MHHNPAGPNLVLLCTATVVALALGGALATPVIPGRAEIDADLGTISAQLPSEPAGPLAPFHLALGATYRDVERMATLQRRGRLRARDDVYLHASLRRQRGDGDLLPAPDGLRVLDGDLFFHQGSDTALVEATLLVEATISRETAITTLEAWLGTPSFEVLLPGALNLALGWQTPRGYLLATFSDLQIFQISAFSDRPADLMAGSQIVLFEGLNDYSRDRAEGLNEAELSARLDEVVRWVESARRALRRVR
ncbi:MAG: hypothetical protein Q9Q40_04165 [Acidobacteriota bacterium]|nr:hypothetical protein [Acidobacteriota bacterium]